MGKFKFPTLEEWVAILWESANTFVDDVVRVLEWLLKHR